MEKLPENPVTAAKKEAAAKNRPPAAQERLTTRQIEAIKIHRRAGVREQDIADMMGIGISSVSRYARGIKPKIPDGEKPPEEPRVSQVVSGANGGEKPPPEMPKQTIVQLNVPIDDEMMAMLWGTASIQGFPNLKTYLLDYAIPWLNVLREAQELIGSKGPKDHMVKLNEIVAGYVQFRKLLAATTKKEEKQDVKN